MGDLEDKKHQRLKVGIIMGGLSSEKEVSLESGRNIFGKIERGKYDPIPIFMDGNALLWEIPIKLLMRNSTSDISEDLEEEAIRLPYESLADRVDVVFLGLHGKYGEDGCVQGLLELLGVPYTGSGVLASALGMDKYFSRRILEISGINVPKTVSIRRRRWESDRVKVAEEIFSALGFPSVVKPSREGCSTAVRKVTSAEELDAAIGDAFLWDDLVLIEEFLDGMEVTCGVLGADVPEALTPSETIPTDDVLSLEDKFLYGQGENKTPARLPADQIEKVRETAVRTFCALNLKGYARIDMFAREDGRIVVLEPNTLPGMTPSTVLFHQAAALGITQAALIDRIICTALEVHARKRGPL